jgi:thymidylate synthase
LVELLNVSLELIPNDGFLNFGCKATNKKYADAELNWYLTKSLDIKDIKGYAEAWSRVASKYGEINSNYGWCIFSKENFNQFQSCYNQLVKDKNSRRACMIYTRPSMQIDYCRDQMNDFICTFATQVFIRNNKMYYIVNMRSNDIIYGFFNDFFWHCYVYNMMFDKLKLNYRDLEIGSIFWNANSFHCYEKHFPLLNKIVDGSYNKT